MTSANADLFRQRLKWLLQASQARERPRLALLEMPLQLQLQGQMFMAFQHLEGTWDCAEGGAHV